MNMLQAKLYKLLPMLLVLFLMSFFGVIFATTPASQVQAQTDSFTFGVVGDYGSTSDTDGVLSAIKNGGVSFQIAVGDFSYDTQGSPAGWGTYVKNIMGNIPFVLIQGNHDASQIDEFVAAFPDKLNSQGQYGKQFYYDYPATSPLARFIMISPAHMSLDAAWLNTAIDGAKSSGIQWVLVGMHEPCITVGSKTKCESTEAVMNQLLSKKVDVILYGHDHNYQRTKQLTCAKKGSFDASCVAADGPSFTQGKGSVMAVVGMGGNGLYEVSSSDSEAGYFAAMNSDTYGFLKFNVSKSQLAAQFVKGSGGSFTDSFTINAAAPSGGPSQAPSVNPSPSVPFVCGGSTNSICEIPSVTVPVISGSAVNPTAGNSQPLTTPSGAPQPCETESASIAHRRHHGHHHHRKHKGHVRKGMQEFIKMLIELINKLLEKFGLPPIDINDPNTEQPENPTTDPCNPNVNPSGAPTLAPTISTAQPTSAPSQIPSPSISQ